MNERIKLLAEQADIHGDSYLLYQHRLEKFAELIITDIFNIMNDRKSYNRCTYTNFDLDKAQCVVKELTDKINENFGTKL